MPMSMPRQKNNHRRALNMELSSQPADLLTPWEQVISIVLQFSHRVSREKEQLKGCGLTIVTPVSSFRPAIILRASRSVWRSADVPQPTQEKELPFTKLCFWTTDCHQDVTWNKAQKELCGLFLFQDKISRKFWRELPLPPPPKLVNSSKRSFRCPFGVFYLTLNCFRDLSKAKPINFIWAVEGMQKKKKKPVPLVGFPNSSISLWFIKWFTENLHLLI